MDIVNKNLDMVVFEKLSCGEVFRDKHSNICMKTESHGNANMVYLYDGSFDYLEENERVERVRCQLVIEN